MPSILLPVKLLPFLTATNLPLAKSTLLQVPELGNVLEDEAKAGAGVEVMFVRILAPGTNP